MHTSKCIHTYTYTFWPTVYIAAYTRVGSSQNPLCAIEVNLQCVSDDGGVLAAAINASIAALIDAGVALRSQVFVCVCVRVRVRACVRARVRARVRVRVRVRARVCVSVCSSYECVYRSSDRCAGVELRSHAVYYVCMCVCM